KVSGESATQASIEGSTNQFCFNKEFDVKPVFENKQCSVFSTSSTESCINKILFTDCISPIKDMICGEDGSGIDHTTLKVTKPFHNSTITMENGFLKIGLFGTDGSKGVHTAEYSFEVKNLESLAEFRLTDFMNNDGSRLYINGKEAWSFNWGGAHCCSGTTNVDLKPFIKEGINTVRLENWNARTDWWTSVNIKTRIACACKKQKVNGCYDKYNPTIKPCKEIKSECKKTIDGECVYEEKQFMCAEKTNVSDCQNLIDAGCSQIKSVCSSKDSAGNCLTYSQTYQCKTSEARKENRRVCVEAKCTDGKCYQESSEPDKDFGQAIAMMEATREAGVYGEKDSTGSLRVFNGEGGTCTVKLLAGHNIMSCCKEIKVDVSKASNNATGSKQTQAMGNNPEQAAQQTEGSTYQYDDLYNDDSMMKNLQGDLTGGWLQCNEEERDLAVKRGGSLCTHARTWCSSKTIFGCTEESRSYCCFKSILAKIINREGRKQLGLSLETCEGITVEQLQKLDFSKIDMTEFQNSVVPKNVDLGDKAEKIRERVNKQAVGGYYSE
ncbi:conjugal transfer protein TraN, partial [Acinetobacter baumannii]